MISICLITYNHEKYISQCIEGILSQKIDMPLEIVIGDDNSIDKNRMIITKFRQRYPNIIKPIFREKNIGVVHNFIDTLNNCKGKYIAMISGDDYWTDHYKLQKQVNFLKKHPDYVLVCHNANLLHETNVGFVELGPVNQIKQSFDFSLKDLIVTNPCIASQVMFKNNLITEFPEIYYKSTGEDRQLYMLLSQYGKCRFDSEVTGIYRVHSLSITQSRNTYQKSVAAIYERISNAEMWNEYFGNSFNIEVEMIRKKSYKQLLRLSLKAFNVKTMLKVSRLVSTQDFHSLHSRLGIQLLKILNYLINLFRNVWHSR